VTFYAFLMSPWWYIACAAVYALGMIVIEAMERKSQ
jgi:hypothetical protein